VAFKRERAPSRFALITIISVMEEIMTPSIRILNRIEPKEPLLVAAWPGMGNVAYGAAMYLKESLKASKFAEISPEDVFYRTGVQIKEGIVAIPELPKSEFFYYSNERGKNDLIIFIGESQPVMEKEYGLAVRTVEVAKSFNAGEIITFAATPVNTTHHTEPGVWGVSTETDTLKKLPVLGVKIMQAGHIGGLNGLLLGVGKSAGIKGCCLLGEIPFYTAKIENPKASLAVLKVFMKYSGVHIDLSSLVQMAKFVEEEIDRVSKTTKEEKESSEHVEETSERETEGVPPEVREKIEYMFELASTDISRAGDLKQELDRWGIFQEYEDRFLDLFGKKNM
jgi:proteasome assembly chaperone (PAC2) family protein